MTTSTLAPLSPDIRALLDGKPALEAAKIAKAITTKAAVAAYLVRCREAERARVAALPEWRRHLEDLLSFVPDADRADASASVVLLMSALNARAVIAPLDLAREATEVMRSEINHYSAPTG